MIQKGEQSGLQLSVETIGCQMSTPGSSCSEHFVFGQNSLPPDYILSSVTCQAQQRKNELKICADMRDGLLGKSKAIKTVTDELLHGYLLALCCFY